MFLDCLIQWRVAFERTQLQIILVDADLQQLAFGLEDGEAARPKLRQPGNDGVGAGGGRMALGGAHGEHHAKWFVVCDSGEKAFGINKGTWRVCVTQALDFTSPKYFCRDRHSKNFRLIYQNFSC